MYIWETLHAHIIDYVFDIFTGVFLTFNVQIAYNADLKFDASQSDFNVTTIEAYSKLNVILGQDTDHDEIIILANNPPGDYKFIIDGGGV